MHNIFLKLKFKVKFRFQPSFNTIFFFFFRKPKFCDKLVQNIAFIHYWNETGSYMLTWFDGLVQWEPEELFVLCF